MKLNVLIILSFFSFTAFGQPKEQAGHKNGVLNKTDSSKALLQGNWFGKEYREHSVFRIQNDTLNFGSQGSRVYTTIFMMLNDTLNYAEYQDGYGSLVSNDTFKVTTPHMHWEKLILQLTKDSLLLKDIKSGELSRYWKSNVPYNYDNSGHTTFHLTKKNITGHWVVASMRDLATTDDDFIKIRFPLRFKSIKYQDNPYVWGGALHGIEFKENGEFYQYHSAGCSEESNTKGNDSEKWTLGEDNTISVTGPNRTFKIKVISIEGKNITIMFL